MADEKKASLTGADVEAILAQNAELKAELDKLKRPAKVTRAQVESTGSTKDELHAQEKFKIRLKKTAGSHAKENQPSLIASINGYPFHIQRGQIVEVPESVYLLLVQSGEVDPQRTEDEKYIPELTVATADENYAGAGLGSVSGNGYQS